MADDGADRSREGEVLAGKYALEHRLGSGGMGEVYRARNEVIGRVVAIKLLRVEYARNGEAAARFLREAQAANLVRHPNVVDVLDFGKADDGAPFIVQEFLEGEDLGHHLARVGRMSPEDLLTVMVPIVEALSVAHSKGVVHRDLKPENIFLHRVGTDVVPKILDFGISKIDSPSAQRVTSTGAVMGTPAYMSPEQVVGAKNIDARTDVWAIGVILHELLSGELPFAGDTQGALFVAICTADPTPVTRAAPKTPEDLATIVARCLRRDPAERYASASELARDLRNAREGRAIEPTRKLAAAGPVAAPGNNSAAPKSIAQDETVHANPARKPERPADASAPPFELTFEPRAPKPAVRTPGPTIGPVAVDARDEGARAQGANPRRRAIIAAVGAVGLVGAIAIAAVAMRGTHPANTDDEAATHDTTAATAQPAPQTPLAIPVAPPPSSVPIEPPPAPVAPQPPRPATEVATNGAHGSRHGTHHAQHATDATPATAGTTAPPAAAAPADIGAAAGRPAHATEYEP